MHAIEAQGLRKTYAGGVEAVKGIDFEVDGGEVFGLLGPNGAGKSTTVGMLTTTIVPTAGTARLAGHDVARSPLLARSVSSIVFQEPVVDRGLTGLANLELHTRLWGVTAAQAKRRIGELVETLGLSELIARPVESYSGGERRRLEIARALTSRPQVLFLDEPTVGLDPRIRHELLDVVAGLRDREDLTILLTTHYLDEAQRLCDRVAIIHEGALVALDSPAALLAGFGREILEFRVDRSPEAALAELRERGVAGDDAYSIGARITVPLHRHAAADALAALESQQVRASEIATRVPNLDDNLIVALVLSALQVIVLIGLSALRGASFHISVSGLAWFAAAAVLFTVFMYCVAETLASRVSQPEEYIGATPVVAILPFFLAGALFPIGAMPAFLTTIAKFIPLTHALALMRYAFVDPTGKGLHDIWGMSNVTLEAWLSLAVVAGFAAVMTVVSIRLFSRSATK